MRAATKMLVYAAVAIAAMYLGWPWMVLFGVIGMMLVDS